MRFFVVGVLFVLRAEGLVGNIGGSENNEQQIWHKDP